MKSPYKFYMGSLSIEMTRRCNMFCDHCMRGKMENKDLSPIAVDFLFEHVEDISCITPTGGEPSLNPIGLTYIRDAMQKHGTHVGGIYVVTNGLELSDDFLMEFIRLQITTEMEEGCCGLALSQDIFHDDIPDINRKKLELFACFDPDSKKTDWTKIQPYYMGRAAEIEPVPCRIYKHSNPLSYAEISEDTNTVYLYDATLALTVDGDLLYDCDYSYDNTDSIKICNVLDPDWPDKLVAAVRAAQADDEENND